MTKKNAENTHRLFLQKNHGTIRSSSREKNVKTKTFPEKISDNLITQIDTEAEVCHAKVIPQITIPHKTEIALTPVTVTLWYETLLLHNRLDQDTFLLDYIFPQINVSVNHLTAAILVLKIQFTLLSQRNSLQRYISSFRPPSRQRDSRNSRSQSQSNCTDLH